MAETNFQGFLELLWVTRPTVRWSRSMNQCRKSQRVRTWQWKCQKKRSWSGSLCFPRPFWQLVNYQVMSSPNSFPDGRNFQMLCQSSKQTTSSLNNQSINIVHFTSHFTSFTQWCNVRGGKPQPLSSRSVRSWSRRRSRRKGQRQTASINCK